MYYMEGLEVTPSSAKKILYADSIYDVAEGAVDSQPDLVEADDEPWVSTPRNSDLLYGDGSTPEERIQRSLRASSLMHDLTNEMIVQGYRNGFANNPEGLELIIDRALESEHPSSDYINIKSRELRDNHDIDLEYIDELEVWGRTVGGVKNDLSENLPYIKRRLNGDNMRPESEDFESTYFGDIEYRTMADLRFSDRKKSEVAETKIKWSQDPDIPIEEDIFQARLTAKIQGAQKAYLIYAGQGEVFEYTPLSDNEIQEINNILKPLIEETSEVAGWDSQVDEVDSELKSLLRDELDQIFLKYWKNEILGEELEFKRHQNSLKAYN